MNAHETAAHAGGAWLREATGPIYPLQTGDKFHIPGIKISTRMGGDGYPLSGVSSASGQRSEG